jgi:cysteine sulfinate desulfinase/cysteine desulfurase-like protein
MIGGSEADVMEASAVGNPHSEHVAGRRASTVVEDARRQVADLIGARHERASERSSDCSMECLPACR